MKLDKLICELYDSLDLGTPPSEKAGVYELLFPSQITLTITPLNPGIFIWTPLGLLQQKKREELFMLLAKANFLGQGTGKSCITLDPDEKFLTLSLRFPYEMDYKQFKEHLEEFVNYAEFWKTEIARLSKASEEQIL